MIIEFFTHQNLFLKALSMYKKWIILDCNFLCHRAKHSMGGLSHGDSATGVIYGFLKGLISYQEMFDTSNFVFCLDSKSSKRKEVYPEYKANRINHDLDDEEIEFENAFRHQMKMLRKEYLKTIGFKNVLCQKGYEADDLIASVSINIPSDQEAVIVSSDHDLFQLLSFNVSQYLPNINKTVSLQWFKKTYGIKPTIWPVVKALAGCSGDNVIGIKGAGENTIIKYLKKELNPETKTYKKIVEQEPDFFQTNHPLVALPYAGTKVFKLKKDNLSQDGWNKVTAKLGMRSIKDRLPIQLNKRKHKNG